MPPLPILIIIGLVLVLIIAIVIGVFISSRSERGLMEERLGKYLEEDKNAIKDNKSGAGAFTEWVNKRVEKSSLGDRIAKNLGRADIKIKPGEFVFIIIILSTVLGLAGFFLAGTTVLYRLGSMGFGVAVGIFGPVIYLRTQQGKRLQKFNDQLSDMLNLVVNGLRAGYSTMQAMEAVSRELPAPISDEFRRVVQEMQLGLPMEKALDNLIKRIPSEDLDFVITAINVQREVGGPLAEILDTIAFTIRERQRIKGEIRVMVAQVVMSGRILSAVPFAVFTLLWFINQKYMGQFFEPQNLSCGLTAILTGVVMIGIGYATMMKIADIQV